MTRRTLRGYKGDRYKAWTCRERHKGRKGNGCTCRTIRETDLIAAICVQMGWEQVAEEKLTEIERVLVSEDGVEIVRSTLSVSA
jgi:succinate dehydrogenase flavin-adding protein (antitoxin of CptAB toxin-antitoxin module)